MREYYPKYAEIPKDIYNQVKGILQGYDRLKRERLDLLHGSPAEKGGSRRYPGTGNPTEQKALKLSHINVTLDAIDQAQMWMRGKLGDGVSYEFDPIKAFWNYDYFNCEHVRTLENGAGPSISTWRRYKYRFVALVAKNLNIF